MSFTYIIVKFTPKVLVGIKIFFINGVFIRSPSLKARFDSVGRFWAQLPTDADLVTEKEAAAPYPAAPRSRPVGPETYIDSFDGFFGAQPGKLQVTSQRVFFANHRR